MIGALSRLNPIHVDPPSTSVEGCRAELRGQVAVQLWKALGQQVDVG